MISKFAKILQSIRFNLIVHRLPDRRYIREVQLPACGKQRWDHVLLVGTRRYTQAYPKFFTAPTTVWTMDFDPDAARFGNAPFHRTGDVCDLTNVFEGRRFNMIQSNGIIGFGVNSDLQIRAMVDSVYSALEDGGYWMIGWDTDRTSDPIENAYLTKRFDHTACGELPARHAVLGIEGFPHTFDWFRKR